MKNLVLSLSVVCAISVCANVIPWSIDDLAAPDTKAASPTWQYVFLTGNGNPYVNAAGSNSSVNDVFYSEVDGGTISAGGKWDDGLTDASTKYVVALWDGVTPNSYYVYKSGDTVLTVTAADMNPAGGYAPNNSIADGLAAGSVVKDGQTYLLSPAAVPEPATAALAFLGMTMLLRRRK